MGVFDAPNEAPASPAEVFQRAKAQARSQAQRGAMALHQPGAEGLKRARENLEGAMRTMQNHPKPIEQAIADFEQIINGASLDAVSGFNGLLHPEEQRRIDRIEESLAIPTIQRDRVACGRSYVQPLSKTELGLDKKIYEDIEWLGVQLQSEQDPGRKHYFETYQNLLTQISLLDPNPNNRTSHPNACREIIRHRCSDPGRGKATAKALVMLSVAGLAVFELISNKGKPTIYLAAMLGLLAWLGSGGSKLTLLKGDAVAELVRSGALDKKTAQDLMHMKAARFNHFMAVVKKSGTERIGESHIKKISHPIRAGGREDTTKAVPEKLARKFLGKNASSVYTMLLAFSRNKDREGKQFVPEWIETIEGGNSDIQQQLHKAMHPSS